MRIFTLLLALIAPAMLVERWARPLMTTSGNPTTTDVIARSFNLAVERRYDCLIVGNSRIFRGINPDMLRQPAFNFANDNDSFNQVYYKLRYVERAGASVHTLILGVDYFEFSFVSGARNLSYARFLGPDYLNDYQSSSPDRLERITRTIFHPIDEEAFNTFMIVHLTRPAGALLGRGLAWVLRDDPPPPIRIFQRDNGQMVMEGVAARDSDLVRRSSAARLPLQTRYFHASLEWAKTHHVRAVLVMPPVRDVELRSYAPGVLPEFDRWLADEAARAGAVYLDYSTRREFALKDFSDTVHLTPAAADRFSQMLDADLSRLGVFQ